MIFNRGHRLRIHVASTSSPALEPNLQNGKPPRTGNPAKAEVSLLFDGTLPNVLLPVTPD
jgi:predicted acyl esterase